MIKVGLTGGIGSGKTTVLKMFEALGVPVYVSDLHAKRLMTSNTSLQKKLINLFGPNTYNDDLSLNTGFVAKQVFSDTLKLSELNKLVHPIVYEDFQNFCIKNSKLKYIIYESALLFESNSVSLFDKIITVTAPIDYRIERIIKRDKCSTKAIYSRISNQSLDIEKFKQSDYVISNMDLKLTQLLVLKIHNDFMN